MARTLIFLFTITFGIGGLMAQEADMDRLVKAMENNSVEELTAMFDHSIEMVTPYAEGVYSQKQAAQVLKSFFSKHPCTSFALDHTGNSSGGSKFVIASYQSGGANYRVSIFLKKEGDGYLIQGLSFED